MGCHVVVPRYNPAPVACLGGEFERFKKQFEMLSLLASFTKDGSPGARTQNKEQT